MKRISKNILGVSLLVLLSAGVAGITAYKVAERSNELESVRTFNEVFEQSPLAQTVSFNRMDAQPVDLTVAAESSVNAVVHIRSTQLSKTKTIRRAPDIFDFFFGDPRGGGMERQYQTEPRVGFGSGVIISKDGYIVTNNHVIEGADEITVKLNDHREFIGRLIGTDPSTDLALVKIESKDDLPTIPVGNSEDIKVGEWVLAVGNPFNLTSTVTAGIVSAKARSLGVYNGGIESFIQTDAAINQGNSGGALVNSNGELIGINAVLTSPTGTYAGYGFAIPSSIMTKVVTDLKQYGTVQRALLGVKGMSLSDDRFFYSDPSLTEEVKEKAKELGVSEGFLISEIVDGGAAANSDLKVDDVIIGIDGKRVSSFASLQEALTKHRPGDKVKVKVVRNKKEKDIDVVLKNEQGTTKIVKDADMELLGAGFVELSDEKKKDLNLGYGLEVSGVTSGKMANAGIKKGFIILRVNDKPMRKVSDLEEEMKAASKSTNPVLFITGIFPSGKRAFYAVDLIQD